MSSLLGDPLLIRPEFLQPGDHVKVRGKWHRIAQGNGRSYVLEGGHRYRPRGTHVTAKLRHKEVFS